MKTPAATEITTSAPNKRNSKFTQRQRRLLSELIQHGAISPFELFPIVGTTGVPQIVAGLRAKGIQIACERIQMKDRDGQTVRPGRYSLQKGSIEKLQEMGFFNV